MGFFSTHGMAQKMGVDLGLAIIATSADKTEENSVSTGSTHTQESRINFCSFWQNFVGNLGRQLGQSGGGWNLEKKGIERAGKLSSFSLASMGFSIQC